MTKRLQKLELALEGTVLRSKPKRLDELPRQKIPTKARQGPLSESEEAEEDLEEEAYGGGLGGSGSPGEDGDGESHSQVDVHSFKIGRSKRKAPDRFAAGRRKWCSRQWRERRLHRIQEECSSYAGASGTFGGGPQVPVSHHGSQCSERFPFQACSQGTDDCGDDHQRLASCTFKD